MADGDCLFHSFAALLRLNGTDISHTALRRILLDWQEANLWLEINGKPLAGWILVEYPQMSLEVYLSHMRKTGIFGGAIEIEAFCQCFNCDVDVFVYDSRFPVAAMCFLKYRLIARLLDVSESYLVHHTDLDVDSALS
ncbi:hypothetical protein M885DRAFT_623708 [Pelagophyceae sp. CCMP2097]|nr:hypothetical protein M885DRAFT_623708 [Pelagophyceae sp. CCMP2097]